MDNKKLFCFLFAFVFLFSFYAQAYAGTVTRSFSSTTIPKNGFLTVSLNVIVEGVETFYAVDETLPLGWLPSNAGLGSFNNGHWRYVIIQGAANTTLQYSLIAPQQAGSYSFSGVYQFEKQPIEQIVLGERNVSVSNIVEVGNKDLSFVAVSSSNVSLSADVKPDFSIYSLLGTTVPKESFVLSFQPQKIGKSVLFQYQAKPIIFPSTWNPRDYYFSIDTVLQGTGQYVEFFTFDNEGNELLNHWNYRDTNEIVFSSANNLMYPVLFFNSLTRNFQQEAQAGFVPYKIAINNTVVSFWFSNNLSNATKEINMFDLITQSKSVCNGGDANVTWFDGNTYFVNADSNVDVENCQLTINAGAVVKYKATPAGNTNLKITNKGILVAKGTPASKIYFTSENDCSIGTTITGTSNDANCGTAKNRDYANAINLASTSGLVPDSNNLAHLVVGYAKQGILISFTKFMNSIHDSNIHDNNSTTSSGAGISIGLSANFWDINNNVFYNNYSTTGVGAGIDVDGALINFNNNTLTGNSTTSGTAGISNRGAGTITNFYNNTISNNSATTGNAGVGNTSGTITNFYNNIISNNSATSGNAGINNTTGLGGMENMYDNNIVSNSTSGAGSIIVIGTGTTSIYDNNISNNTSTSTGTTVSITANTTNFFNNIISNNSSTGNGIGISLNTSGVTITNFYNNKIFGNTTTSTTNYGGGLYVGNGTITNAYNNLFYDNRGGYGAGVAMLGTYSNKVCTSTATITKLFNNTFVNNKANAVAGGGAIYLTSVGSGLAATCATINNIYNNIIAFSTNTGIVKGSNANTDSNSNAFWANDTNTSGYTEGTKSIYLGTTPFINDRSDRNFLLNSYGITQLQGRGNSSTGTNSFFTARTVRYDNRLDYNRSIGYHYDQNSPYIAILNPSIGKYGANVSIDFNVSSNGINADVNIDLNILKFSAQDQNVFYDKNNYANWTCNAALPATTKDKNCTFILNSILVPDGNYLIKMTATDKNGTSTILQLQSWQIQQDQIAPDMNNDANFAWQNFDANVQIWCNDISKGNSDINSIAINKDSTGWQFFSFPAGIKIADANALFNSDGNHDLNYFCSDGNGNTTDINHTNVLIDKNAPTTTLSESSGIITLSCLDIISNCFLTQYRVNGGTWINYIGAFSIGSTSQIDYNSTDNAGNTETTKIIMITVPGSPTGGGISDGIVERIRLDLNAFLFNQNFIFTAKIFLDGNTTDPKTLETYFYFSTGTVFLFDKNMHNKISRGFYEISVDKNFVDNLQKITTKTILPLGLAKEASLTIDHNNLQVVFSLAPELQPQKTLTDYLYALFLIPIFSVFLVWHLLTIIIAACIVFGLLFFVYKRNKKH